MIPISLDITTLILYFLMCLTGEFKKVIITFLIIIIHELGHIFYLKLFKVEILKVTIYPFGGLINTNKLLNFNPLKEIFISIGGILNQIILYIIFYLLYQSNLINNYTYNLFLSLNTSLILFNIIPIYPLDGYYLLNSLFNLYFPYLKSNIISLIISIINLFIFSIYSYNRKINSLFVISFLLYKIYLYLREYRYYTNKFLLERIMYDIPYKKIVYMDNYSPYFLGLNKYYYFNYINEKEVIGSIYNLEKKLLAKCYHRDL